MPLVFGGPLTRHCTPQPCVGHEPVGQQALHYPSGRLAVHLKHKNLPDAGGTVIKEAVLSRRGPFIALGSG